MFDFIRNYALPEFWAFWGIPFATVVIAGLAMAFSVWLAPTMAWRRIGIEVAGLALFCGFIYGLGGSKRDALCAAQVAAYEAKFEDMQNKSNEATAKHAAELADKVSTVEQANAEDRRKFIARLEQLEAGVCVASDEFLDGMRQHRSNRAARQRAGKAGR